MESVEGKIRRAFDAAPRVGKSGYAILNCGLLQPLAHNDLDFISNRNHVSVAVRNSARDWN
jgi:hypothetical protein